MERKERHLIPIAHINGGSVGPGDTFWMIAAHAVHERTVKEIEWTGGSVLVFNTVGGVDGAFGLHATKELAMRSLREQTTKEIKRLREELRKAEERLAALRPPTNRRAKP